MLRGREHWTFRRSGGGALPWFELYDEQLGALPATSTLTSVQSVKELDAEKAKLPLQDDDTVDVGPVKKLWTAVAGANGVRDGKW
jgi:hypothetical protein